MILSLVIAAQLSLAPSAPPKLGTHWLLDRVQRVLGYQNVPFRPRAAGAVNAYSIVCDAAGEVASGDCGTACAFPADTNSWTIEFAVKTTSTADIWRTGLMAGTTTAKSVNFLPEQGGATDYAYLNGQTASESFTAVGYDTTYIHNANWHFYSLTYDSALDDCILYADGTQIQAQLVCGLDDGNTSSDLWSICNSVLDGDFLVGKITEVRVWNTVRTPTQIANHDRCQMNCIDGGACPTGLQVYWPFIEGSGTNVDEKALGTGTVDLTLAGTVTWDTADTPFGGWTNDSSNDCQ